MLVPSADEDQRIIESGFTQLIYKREIKWCQKYLLDYYFNFDVVTCIEFLIRGGTIHFTINEFFRKL